MFQLVKWQFIAIRHKALLLGIKNDVILYTEILVIK